jgi:hypothetical protein
MGASIYLGKVLSAGTKGCTITLPTTASYDPDAQAFFTAAGITDSTQKSAVNQLVLDLKSYNIWTKMQALYPMVGGTNSQHSWNLKNTAQFQISWQGGVVSSSNGVQFNGTNSYGITGYNPSVNGSLNSHHFSFYSRTNSNGTEVEAGVQASGGGGARNLLEIRTSGTTYVGVNSGGTYTTFLDSDSRAFYIANRTASNVINAWRNSTKAATGTTASFALPNGVHWLGAWNNLINPPSAFYSTKQCAFASIGDGLTDTEAANFYTAVQNMQTTLSRQV